MINTCMYYKSTTTGQFVQVHGVPAFDVVKVSIDQLKIETRSSSKIQKRHEWDTWHFIQNDIKTILRLESKAPHTIH